MELRLRQSLQQQTYNALNVAASDYYEVEVSATAATDVKVETVDGGTDPRALFVGLKAIAQ